MRRNPSRTGSRFVIISAALLLGVSLSTPLYAHHLKKGATTDMPVTAQSAQARELYGKGMADYENLYLERCNQDWRAAVKEDPNLAVAWAWIAFNSTNPVEVSQLAPKRKNSLPRLRRANS